MKDYCTDFTVLPYFSVKILTKTIQYIVIEYFTKK